MLVLHEDGSTGDIDTGERLWDDADVVGYGALSDGYRRRDIEELVWRNHGRGSVRSYTRNGRVVRGYERGKGPGQHETKPGDRVNPKTGRSAGDAVVTSGRYKGLTRSEAYAEKLRDGSPISATERRMFGDATPAAPGKGTRLGAGPTKTPPKDFTVHQSGRAVRSTATELKDRSEQVVKYARRGQLGPADMAAWRKAAAAQTAAVERARQLIDSPQFKALPKSQQRAILADVRRQQRMIEKSRAKMVWVDQNRAALDRAARGERGAVNVPRLFLN